MVDVEERGPLDSVGTTVNWCSNQGESMAIPQHIKTVILHKEDKSTLERYLLPCVPCNTIIHNNQEMKATCGSINWKYHWNKKKIKWFLSTQKDLSVYAVVQWARHRKTGDVLPHLGGIHNEWNRAECNSSWGSRGRGWWRQDDQCVLTYRQTGASTSGTIPQYKNHTSQLCISK